MTSAARFFPPQARIAPVPVPELPLTPGDRGPDVSSYQGAVNWQEVVLGGYAFGFTKVTESTTYVNPTYVANWDGMHISGLAVAGAYHFAQPDSTSAEAEVAWFLQHVEFAGNDLPVLDLEAGSGDLHDWTLRFLQLVAEQTGRACVLYSGNPFLVQHNCNQADIAQASGGIWIAAYQASAPPPPQAWVGTNKPFWWQSTDAALVPGVSGPCDLSLFMGFV